MVRVRALLLSTLLIGSVATPARADAPPPPTRPTWDEEPPPNPGPVLLVVAAGIAVGVVALRASRANRPAR